MLSKSVMLGWGTIPIVWTSSVACKWVGCADMKKWRTVPLMQPSLVEPDVGEADSEEQQSRVRGLIRVLALCKNMIRLRRLAFAAGHALYLLRRACMRKYAPNVSQTVIKFIVSVMDGVCGERSVLSHAS